MYESVPAMLGWAGLIVLGLVGLATAAALIVAAGLRIRVHRAQRQRPSDPVAETPAQVRWRKTRERDQGDPEVTEVIPRYRDLDESR